MMQGLLNAMRLQASMAESQRVTSLLGVVKGYDPDNYCAKVELQPGGVLTGWLPVTSPLVGSGWGFFAPPTIGDVVEVRFQEDEIDAGYICTRFFTDSARPVSIPSGEFYLVHKSGSFLKFKNTGDVELHSDQNLTATVGGDASISVAGSITSDATQWDHTGDMSITGDVVINGSEQVTGLLTGQGGMAISGGSGATVNGNMAITSGDVTADGISLKTHVHGGVSTGGSNTGQPQ